MLFGKKFIRGLLTKLSRRQSSIVSIEELCELIKDRRSLDETIVRLSKENEILRERVSVLQDIVESHKYENFDKMGKESGAVLLLGNKGDTDSLWLQEPYVIFVNGMYKMWYSGNNGYRWRIHYATSKDGKKWIKHGPILILDFINIDKDIHEYRPSVIYDGNKYHMWYEGDGGDYTGVYYATSIDGKNWKKESVAIELGKAGESDEITVTNPNVVFDGKKYHMWYAGSGNKCSKIHYATSTDGKNWIKQGVVKLNNDSENDYYRTSKPFVIIDNNIFRMWYISFIDGRWVVHYATSTDGKNWIDHGEVLQFLPKHIGEIYDIKTPCIIKDGDVYKAWFSGRIDDKWRIYSTVLSESSITK